MHILKSFFVLVLISDFLMTSAALELRPASAALELRPGRLSLIESHMRSLFSPDNHGGRIITQQDIIWFNEMVSAGEFQKYLDSIIPKPNLNFKSVTGLYKAWRHNPLGLSDAIFVGTLEAGINVADDIANRFLNVSCDSLETRNLYIVWLNTALLPEIEMLFAQRSEKIIAAIQLERDKDSVLLELDLENQNTRQFNANREIDDAYLKQMLSLTIVPFLGYYQSTFYESRALRWVSYTACAGLSLTLLYKYLAIIQNEQQKILATKLQQRKLQVEITELFKISLPVDVLNQKTKNLIETLRQHVQNFAQRTREQVREEIRGGEMLPAVLSEEGGPMGRDTFEAVYAVSRFVGGVSKVVKFIKGS